MNQIDVSSQLRELPRQPNLSQFSEFCVDLLEKEVGPLLLAKRQDALTLPKEWKSITDYRTAVDTEIEEIIVKSLSARFPELGLYGEEGGQRANAAAKHQVIIDPIDGTIAWSRNFGDHYSIALALLEDGEPIASVIHFPHFHTTFVAEKGAGAWSRSSAETLWENLKASKEESLQRSVIIVDHGKELRQEAARIMEPLLDKATGANCVAQYLCASYSMASIAQGKIEAFLGTSVPAEDALPGLLLAKEAGAVVSSLDGSSNWSDSSRSLAVCCTPALRDQICKKIWP